jgi:hypothetical protein
MRNLVLVPVLLLTLGLESAGEDTKAVLEKQAASLEHRIADLQRELAAVRAKLEKLSPQKALTPAQAVESFRKNPTESVTVEFGVERIGVQDTLTRVGDDPDPSIIAKWDNYLPGGGTLTAILPPSVYKKLLLPTNEGKKVPLTPGSERQQVVDHVEKHGIRVTGLLRDKGFDQYVIVVADSEKVVLYIAGSGM